MREIEWTEAAISDMAAIDKGIARRVKNSVERFAATGAGNARRLTAIDPPEFRLRVGDYRVRFHMDGGTMRILRVRHRSEAYR
jgi:mRNA-degrading endonuclease RelE of RelBE toxin-antitoxin system